MFQTRPFIDRFSRFLFAGLREKNRFMNFPFENGENRENGRNI